MKFRTILGIGFLIALIVVVWLGMSCQLTPPATPVPPIPKSEARQECERAWKLFFPRSKIERSVSTEAERVQRQMDRDMADVAWQQCQMK